MTQEHKQLLLKDLCARLPYGVIVQENDGVNENDNKLLNIDMFDRCINYDYIIDDIKPYLRPMSSMTEEERDEVKKYMKREQIVNVAFYHATEKTYDWYNAHHFDYRGLIPMGLALEAPEGMYNYENN